MKKTVTFIALLLVALIAVSAVVMILDVDFNSAKEDPTITVQPDDTQETDPSEDDEPEAFVVKAGSYTFSAPFIGLPSEEMTQELNFTAGETGSVTAIRVCPSGDTYYTSGEMEIPAYSTTFDGSNDRWYFGEGDKNITVTEDQDVSEAFYNWFIQNATLNATEG